MKPETALVRPFVVCAVLRGVTLDQARYKGFIDLQDKLHQNLCRQRSLVAIGTHDLGKLQVTLASSVCSLFAWLTCSVLKCLLCVQPPFTYQALPPEDISFVPLKQTRSFNARQLFQVRHLLGCRLVCSLLWTAGSSAGAPCSRCCVHCTPQLCSQPVLLQHYTDHDDKLRKFLPIIASSLVYPVITDVQGTVLSLPPIINGAHSAVRPTELLSCRHSLRPEAC